VLAAQCFSAVVGPNGSGKSNVIDALLFVFGRRSQQLRSKKVVAKASLHG
jgi:structural maintenance of chromosome 4